MPVLFRFLFEPLGWASYPYRAATTNYLCYVPVLEDSKGAGRTGLTRVLRLQS